MTGSNHAPSNPHFAPLRQAEGMIMASKPAKRFVRVSVPHRALIITATVLFSSAPSGGLLFGDEPRGKSIAKVSLKEHLDKIVRTSQAIDEVRVGECRKENDRRMEETERPGFNDHYAKHPELRAGGHFAVIELKEKPSVAEDEFGKFFDREVLSPSLEVGLDLFPEPRYTGDLKFRGRLWASYRALPITAHIGFPRWSSYGMFGAVFQTSAWRGEETKRQGLSVEELDRLTTCQVMTRVTHKDGVGERNFFTLPVDLYPDGSFHELFHVPQLEVKRVWSTYRDQNGDQWLLWCRKGPEPNTVQIRQCVVETRLMSDRRNWVWDKASELQTVTRKTGERHTVSNLSFTIDEMKVESGASSPFGWVHIADPDLRNLPPPVDRK
jgi:hypothetical protein